MRRYTILLWASPDTFENAFGYTAFDKILLFCDYTIPRYLEVPNRVDWVLIIIHGTISRKNSVTSEFSLYAR